MFLFLIELGSFFLSSVFNLYKAPKYVYNSIPKSLDINPRFGVWHLSNSTFKHVSTCFNVSNDYNSYGARDKEHPTQGQNRFFVIGDSFIEGYGIEEKDRISDLLESYFGYGFLNFSSSGGFGSTQMYYCYDYFKDSFEHEGIIIGLFPTNDFFDDNLEFAKISQAHRYRPFHVKSEEDSSYQLKYFLDDISKSEWSIENKHLKYTSKISAILKNHSHFFSILSQINQKNTLKSESEQLEQKNKDFRRPRYAHEDFKEFELDLLLYNLSLIRQSAPGKKIYVFTIPAKWELYRYYKDRSRDRLSERLKKELTEINIEFIDVTNHILDNTEVTDIASLYHTCDGHWNEKGNRICAEFIKSRLTRDSIFIQAN